MELKSLIRNSQFVLPSSIEVDGSALEKMYFKKDVNSRVHTGEFVKRIIEFANKKTGKEFQVKQCFLEKKTIFKVDKNAKLIHQVSDEELLATDISELSSSRTIVKLKALNFESQGMSPTIALNIIEHTEDIAFGNDVEICKNFTLFAPRIVSSKQYFKKKYDLNDLLSAVFCPKHLTTLKSGLKQIL